MSSPNLTALALFASLACHLFFKKYEPTDVPRLVGLLIVPPAVVAYFCELESGNLAMSLLRSYSLYYSGLLFSILTYRISPLHPLSKYPGPLICKISKLWITRVASQGKLHQYVKSLHDRYGPIVRVGPNELSIIEVSLLPAILGSNGMPKGPLWDGRKISGKKGSQAKEAARGNLIGSRDPEDHAEARKAWNRAFNAAAIKGYEPILLRRVTQFIEALGSRQDATVDLSRWLSFFAFDFMGDIAFGGGFELMRDGDKDGMWHIMESGLFLPTLTQQIPWCIGFIPYLPVGKEMKALGKFAFDQSKRRVQEGSVHDDLFYYLLDDKRADSATYPFPLVVSNAVLAIVAGSDTSATVLSNTFFFLLTHPASYKRLQLEIDQAFPLGSKEPTDPALLANLPYLNAVIKESLRLLPPLPTSMQRAPTPGSGSKVIAPNFVVSEGTSIIVPPYSLHRDPRYFSPSPDEFIPDRWLADEKFTVNGDAFIPFSMGPANCAGKNLAMLELRMIMACVLQRFEVRLADGYDVRRWEAELKDYFVMQKGSLPVVLTSRAAQK
ncbi:cytochrome P450 [Favolaschia claudopus]|uniref:Cytochrome P450 n=1 Tax=Favolaschia claudopus TaxID=2862362 RepID=A0AAW0CTU5_9AGAR